MSSLLRMEKSSSLTVVKHNKVVEASYMLTISEQRVLLSCIAQINAIETMPQNRRFEVTATGVADLAGLDSLSNAYRDLKKAAEKLFDRFVTIEDPDPLNPKIAQRRTRWISTIDYVPGDGKLILTFADGIVPYLSQLSREFTQYKLRNVAKFESVYSIRLYELLVQWQSVGNRELEVEWIKTQFQVADKYPRVVDLKKRVIEPAVAEINQHSNLWVDYGQRKTGRTITHFQFCFGIKGKDQMKQKPKHFTDAEIADAARPGETTGQVINRLLGNDLSKTAKPGETTEQAVQRKKALAEAKKKLGKGVLLSTGYVDSRLIDSL